MNGAVFFIWFQSDLHQTRNRHLGEFSEAEIAARQADFSKVGVRQRLGAVMARLTEHRGLGLPRLARSH